MSAAEIVLELWDTAAEWPAGGRGTAMLAAVWPEFDTASRSVGECEAQLLALYETFFGGELNGFARCPPCGEALELTVDIAALRKTAIPTNGDGVLWQGGFVV